MGQSASQLNSEENDLEKCAFCRRNEQEVQEGLFFCKKCLKDDDGVVQFYCIGCGNRRHTKEKHKFTKTMMNKYYHQAGQIIKEKNEKNKRLVKALEVYLKNKQNDEKLAIKEARKIFYQRREDQMVTLSTGVISAVDGLSNVHSGVTEGVNLVASSALFPGISYAVVCGAEMLYFGVELYRGKINGKEFAFRCGKSMVRTGAGALGSWAGWLAGAAVVGATAATGVGAIVICIAGAIISGMILSGAFSIGFEQVWKKELKEKCYPIDEVCVQ